MYEGDGSAEDYQIRDKATGEPRGSILFDYYEVQYLKRTDNGAWMPANALFPDIVEAETHAAKLKLGNQASVRVIGRTWA